MTIPEQTKKSVLKKDLCYISILMAIALIIGIYLIFTTVLIAKDGVGYIERAQLLQTSPEAAIKMHPPGYPFLILMAHKFISLFVNASSNQSWIFVAQGVTLLCRLLAIIPLYFIGKLLVGNKNSFWAMLILILLPYPAELGSDVLREWPYLLFLAMGFSVLLWATKYGKWWAFGLVGLTCGLGYLIRPESLQLILYGTVWLGMCVFKPNLWNVSRGKSFIAIALLFLGFAIPAAPYMKCTGKILPPKVNYLIETFSKDTPVEALYQPESSHLRLNHYAAEMVSGEVLKALGKISNTIGETLMWFFVPMLIIGFCYHLKHEAKYEEQFLTISFILINIIFMVLLYCHILPHINQRWSLPLVTFTVFYIPLGLQIVENWLNNKQKTYTPKDKRLSWFLVLLLIGIGICLPKLLRPTRIKKQSYLDAAIWLHENTKSEDVIAVPDKRITFYAERHGTVYYQNPLFLKKGYIVTKGHLNNDMQIAFCDVLTLHNVPKIIATKKIFQKDFKNSTHEVNLEFSASEEQLPHEFRTYLYGGISVTLCAIDLQSINTDESANSNINIDLLNGNYAFSTQIGTIDYPGHKIITTQFREGFLDYGPYMPIAKGNYIATFKLKLDEAKTETFEVWSSSLNKKGKVGMAIFQIQ